MTAFLTKYRTAALGVLAALVLLTAIGARLERNRNIALANAEYVLHVAQDSLHVVLHAVVARDAAIATMVQHADSAALRASSAERAATVWKARVPALLAQVEASHGDTLTDVETAFYTALESRADSLDVALKARTAEATQLHMALDSAERSVHQLIPAAVAVDTAATRVVATIRPSLFARITPKQGFGFAAGIDQNGRPALVAGITLSWPR